MKVMIVDDEKLARDEMRYLLAEEPDIEIACEASSGREALELARSQDIDLIFLDIQMPVMDGFEVVRALIEGEKMPLIVFATAYDRYAIKALEVKALDYLLKPIEKEALERALNRARESVADRRDFVRRLKKLTETIKVGKKFLSKIVVIVEGKASIIEVDKVALLKQAGHKVEAYTDEGELVANYKSLDELEGDLDPDVFIRLGSEYIVNVERISSIVPWSGGNYIMTMIDADDTEVRLTQSQAKLLKNKIEGVY
ncbi:hypothetical protein DRQ05_00640 [bacterium]|nr:MAG: hypothetical protein DRQ05_00640 [bacterium]